MGARLFIEAATYNELDNWVFVVTEYMDLEKVGGEMAIRALDPKHRIRRPFTLTIEAETPRQLKSAAAVIREAGLLRSAKQPGQFLTPDELLRGNYWRSVLATVRALFTRDLYLTLRQGDRPFYSKQLVERILTGWARSKAVPNEVRSEIYATLAAIEHATDAANAGGRRVRLAPAS